MPQNDLTQIETILRLVDHPIWIVTATDGSRTGGLVATWVYQASIDQEKPVVLAGIAPNHFTAELIDAGGAMGLHLISPEQIDLAWNFAIGSGRDRNKLAGIDTIQATTGSPILRECLSWLDCRVFARLATGDRIFYWSDVVAGSQQSQGRPLTESGLIAAATPHQKQVLLADRGRDIQLQRPLARNWRENLPDLMSATGNA